MGLFKGRKNDPKLGLLKFLLPSILFTFLTPSAIPANTQGSVTPIGVALPWATLCRPILGLICFLAGITAFALGLQVKIFHSRYKK